MLAVFFIHLAGLMSPGPDFFYVSRQAVSKSILAGVFAALGIGIGIMFWAGLAIFGIKILNFADHLLQYLIMLLGGLYLTYIGLSLLRSQGLEQNLLLAQQEKYSLWKEIPAGLLINLCNAKAGIYFASIVSSVVLKFEPRELIWLWLFFVVSTFLYFCLIALLFSRAQVRKIYWQHSKQIDRITGLLFLVFGLILLYEALEHFWS